MKVFETVNVEVPTSDVERKDFKLSITMAVSALIILIIITFKF